MTIPIEVKAKCVKLHNEGQSIKSIYFDYFVNEHSTMSYETFRHKIRLWKKQQFADPDTLCSGTYPGFIAHDATVQVAADGTITQAWIKQKAEDIDWDSVVEVIKSATNVTDLKTAAKPEAKGMLEIPLFDMHFGVASNKDYLETQASIANIIRANPWEEINFVIGQDLIHNNDMKGHTVKGTNIERIDVPKAWHSAQVFYIPLIELAIESANVVNILYSKANHDECISWCFVQMLKERYPNIFVDDSLQARKCIFWKGCFIGFCHGCETKSKNEDLRGQFTIKFPMEFANSKVREIHTGHLHTEKSAAQKQDDVYGVMVRHLSSGVPTDEWSDDNGFVGSHKRFQLFGYEPDKLKTIYYV